MQNQTIPKHPFYTQVDQKEADAVSWILTHKDSELQQYSFKFPEIKDHEIRAKILHTGLCQSDSLHGRALWHDQVTYPFSPGHEVVGEVTMVGSNVQNFKVGDIVGVGPQRDFCTNCHQCTEKNENICDSFQGLYDPHFGGYGTHIQVSERETFKIPEGMPLEIIPPLLCAGLTVFAPIQRWQKSVGEGDSLRVGVFGIGGLGHLAVQYLNKMGHKVTAFTTSTKREEELKALGATDISHSTDLESLGSEKVLHQYDCIINTLFIEDKDQFVAIQKTIKKGGHLVQVGLPPTRTNMALDVMNLVFNQITLHGSIVGSVQEMKDMLEFSAKHKVYPTCEIFPFEDFPKAFDLLENGRPKFRACVNVTDWAKTNGFDK